MATMPPWVRIVTGAVYLYDDGLLIAPAHYILVFASLSVLVLLQMYFLFLEDVYDNVDVHGHTKFKFCVCSD